VAESVTPRQLTWQGAALLVVGALFVPVEAVTVLVGARLVAGRRIVAGVVLIVLAVAVAAVRLVLYPSYEPQASWKESYRDGYQAGWVLAWVTGAVLTVLLGVHYARVRVDDTAATAAVPAGWRRAGALLANFTVALIVAVGVTIAADALGAPNRALLWIFLWGLVLVATAFALVARSARLRPAVGGRIARTGALPAAAGYVVPLMIVAAFGIAVVSASGRDPAADRRAEARRGFVDGCMGQGAERATCGCLYDELERGALFPEWAQLGELGRTREIRRSDVPPAISAVFRRCNIPSPAG
jgi:hypothetical protein